MKVAIFSDIHSNIDALRATLDFYRSVGVDRYVCLGDVVGYGGAPDECCDLVRPLVATCILGNHDAAVAGRMDYMYYYDAARTALDYHTSLLKPENLEWLRGLPYWEDFQDIRYCHGSPANAEAFDYVLTPAQAMGLLPHWDSLRWISFMGHSHLTKAFALTAPADGGGVDDITSDTLHFERGRKYVVTVGSVGQPRDNDARACATIWDTEEATLSYHRIDYDVGAAARRILDSGRLSPDFGKRLFLGI